MSTSVVIVGSGAIGNHLAERLVVKKINPVFFNRIDGSKKTFEKFLDEHQPRAVFVAISTKDKGTAARDYILESITASIPVITCEKGALAYHADALSRNLSWIGYSAAVGGGTMMLNYLRSRHLTDRKLEIHAVLNGTLNFILDEVNRGERSLAEACTEAISLGYAEPGAVDPLSLINGELRDVRMKICVFFNTLFASGEYVTPNMIKLGPLNVTELQKLASGQDHYRLVISFSNHHENGMWKVIPAFRKISENPNAYSWLPSGVGNAIHLIEGEFGSGGIYTLSGPGAGLEATTSAMLADFEELCRL